MFAYTTHAGVGGSYTTTHRSTKHEKLVVPGTTGCMKEDYLYNAFKSQKKIKNKKLNHSEYPGT